MHALRKHGANTTQMARAACTLAITYGVEVCGMSNSYLDLSRSCTARAAALDGGGKNPNLVLLVVDRAFGTTDPAFDAHVQPAVKWAYAWWEGWQHRERLSTAFHGAEARLKGAVCSVCLLVTGPVSTLIASLWRLKWASVGRASY